MLKMLAFLTVVEDGGARSKLEEIYRLYSREMYYVAYSILRDTHEAEDAAQNAILKVSNYLDKIFEIKCNKTRAFMVIIVRGIAIDMYNKRKKRVSVSFDTVEEALTREDALTPEQYVLRMDRGKKIAKEMSRLNTEYADVLTLKYMYDFTNGEIAGMLNTTEGNIRVKLYRARKALHTLLGGDEYGQ